MLDRSVTPEAEPVAATRERPPSTTVVDVVSGWQRTVGNRAVARLLARQEGGPVRVDRRDPLIRTVRGPILGPGGRYRWLVRFQLPHPAEQDGWLIQLLYEDSHTGDGAARWECWRVRRGERDPADLFVEEGIGFHDRYTHGSGGTAPPRAGFHRHVGVIRFYPGPLPPQFGQDLGGQAYEADTPPTGWTGRGTRHDAYAEWRPGFNGFVAYAGTEELRAGDHVTFRPRGSAGPTSLGAEPETVPQRL